MSVSVITPTAKITMRRRWSDASQWDFVFEWEGPADGIVGISDVLMHDMPDLLLRIPWRLEKVGGNYDGRTQYYRRATT